MHLFILIGASAAGKTTAMTELLADPDLRLMRFPTSTSRPPRVDEQAGIDHEFLSPSEFQERIENGSFFEWIQLYGYRYGTNKKLLDTLRQGDRPIICLLEMEGARKIKELQPNETTIILLEASKETLRNRLIARQLSAAELQRRLERLDKELSEYPKIADFRVNTEGDPAATLDTIKQIIRANI